jgi:hypothetical protein
MLRTLLLITIVAISLGCEPKVSPWTRSELYFGLSRNGAPAVTDEEWQRFMVEVVTPRFPDGLTIVDATGQYRNRKGELINEKSKLLIIIRPTTLEENRKLDDIRAVYKERFGQESVLRLDAPSNALFE